MKTPKPDPAHEIAALRSENQALRQELADALEIMIARGDSLGYAEADEYAKSRLETIKEMERHDAR